MYTSMKWLPHGKCNPTPVRATAAPEESEEPNAAAADPYVAGPDDDSDEDADFAIHPTDCMLSAVCLEDEDSVLEFHLYDTETGSFYVHHDIPIPSIPIQVSFLERHQMDSSGAFVAVCGFSESVDIFDVDLIDSMDPVRSIPSGHDGATIAMDWNAFLPNLFLTGGEDQVVQLHDLTSDAKLPTLKAFSSKVEHVKWSPMDASLYALSGGSEAEVRDGRQQEPVLSYRLPAPSEGLCWFGGKPDFLLVSLEDGRVLFYDRRKAESALWTLQAHSESCTSLSVFGTTLATTSLDGTTKLWGLEGAKPKQRDRKAMNIGPLLCSSFEDQNEILAVGGEKSLALWDRRS